MNKDKNKWVEDVFHSMQGGEQAQPPKDLFAKIERQIKAPEPKIIQLNHWKYAAAAAAILLVNVLAVIQYQESLENTAVRSDIKDVYSQTLISTYQIS